MATDPHTTSVKTVSALLRKLRLFAKQFNDPVYTEAADVLEMMQVRETGLVQEVHDLSLELRKLREAVARNK